MVFKDSKLCPNSSILVLIQPHSNGTGRRGVFLLADDYPEPLIVLKDLMRYALLPQIL